MKSFINLFNVAAVLCMALLFSCENSDDLSGKGILLSEDSLEVSFSGESSVPAQVSFTAYQSWDASTTASWLTISPSSGNAGNFIVSVSADSNETDESRSTTIDFSSGGTVTSLDVNQSKINVLILDQSEFSIDGLENEVAVEFTTNNSFEVLISSNDQEWVSLVETKATEDYTRTFLIAANTTTLTRSTSITISNSDLGISETVTITQDGYPTITIDEDPAEYELTYMSQSHTVNLFSTVDYEVAIPSEAQSWLSAVKAEDGQSITFTATENLGEENRIAEVSLICDERFEIDQTIKITQNTFDVVITPNPTSVELPRTDGEFSITVTTNVDVIAKIENSWITETSCTATSSENEWIYTFAYQENDVLESRSNTIEFYNEERDRGETVTITQEKQLNSATITVTAGDTLTAAANALDNITQYESVTIIGEDVALTVNDINAIKLFTSAKIVDISQTATVSIHGEAFSGNTHIEEFIFPNTLTTLLGTAFMNSSLTTVTIPGSVTTWGNAVFTTCSKIKEVIIEEGCTAIGQQAFLNNTALETVHIPSTIESWLTIATAAENKAFGNCTALKNIYLAEGLTKLGTMSFFNTGVEQITIPGSICEWPLSSSGVNNCFTGCSQLKTVTLNEGLASIEYTMFNGLGVTSITSYSSTPPAMAATTTASGTACGITGSASVNVYVPASYISAYSAAAFWMNCTISAIEE